MNGASVAAFVATRSAVATLAPHQQQFAVQSLFHSSSPPPLAQPKRVVVHHPLASASNSMTAILSATAVYQEAALGFFSGIRFPASLIAGSSVAAIFSLVKQAKNTEGLTCLEIRVLRLYHAIAILSLCLSMLTVSTTTTACTLLLLTSKVSASATSYSDIYHYLRAEFNFEFVLTRWAFSSSIVLFLTGVAARILLELDLLKPKRRTAGLLVFSTMMAVILGMLSNINLSLNCWPSLIGMTGEVVQLIGQHIAKHRGPLQFLSIASMISAIACLATMAIRSIAKNSAEASPGP